MREYLGDLLLIGGWVPYLHFTYGDIATPEAAVSLTAEADLVVPANLPAEGRRLISEMLKEARFDSVGETGVVWGRDLEGGEKIEFFLSAYGPELHAGRATPIADQPGLRALSVGHLWVLEAATGVIPFPSPEETDLSIDVRVPSITAFVLNKANTFNLRGGPDGEIKSGKDLLYLRDVMAAGEHVQAILECELEGLLASRHADRCDAYIRRAVFHLRTVAERYDDQTIESLIERDGLVPADAQADLEGHLTDLVVLLKAALED